MKRVRIAGAAERELAEAITWYRDRDPRVADRFTAEVRAALQMIETFPQIGSRVPSIADRAVRRMPVHKFPYYVVFVELDDALEVVAFAHNRRRPAYFVRRIRN